MPNPWQKSSAKTRTRTALSQMSPIKTQSAALQILGELGGLEILINNAADLGAVPLALLADTNCEDLEKAVATNVLGPFRLTKALLGALSAAVREGRAALVINISSDAAVTPYPKWGAYGASKAALRHLTEIWKQETWIPRCTRSLFRKRIRRHSKQRKPPHAS